MRSATRAAAREFCEALSSSFREGGLNIVAVVFPLRDAAAAEAGVRFVAEGAQVIQGVQHRAAKAIVARAAAEAGWTATIEHPAPDLSCPVLSWRADVLAEKDDRRIALEIQWSKQAMAVSRPARHATLQPGLSASGSFTAATSLLPKKPLSRTWSFMAMDCPSTTSPGGPSRIQSYEMTKLLLDGGYVDRVEAKITDVTFQLTEMNCNLCKKDSTIWRIGTVAVRSRCQQTASFQRASYTAWTKERLERCLYSEAFRLIKGVAPLAPLRLHYSRAVSTSYLAYGCAHCERGFFGDFFVASNYDWDEVTVPVAIRIPIDEELLEEPHNCQDNGFGRCSQEPKQHSGPVFEGYAQRKSSSRLEADVTAELVGETISISDAANIRVGRSWAVPFRSSSNWGASRPQKPVQQPVSKPLQGTCDPHPEFECLGRQLRALLNVPEGTRHYSDDIRDRITSGAKPVEEGTEFLRRCLQRSQPLR